MGEPHNHGARTMHAGRCRTFEEVPVICSLIGNQSQEPHSDTIGSRQDSVRGLTWIRMEAIFAASLCVWMLGFRARSEREMKEAGLQSHTQHIRWVQHTD